jgi:alpha-glucosidase (family GH31 glycosyl hydrolase)
MIIHEPFGNEHPYDHLPQERIPRQPVAGQPVMLGVVAAEGTRFDRVWATWRIDNDPVEYKTDGMPHESGWRVNLPSFSSDQQVTYRLSGQNPQGLTESPEFAFDVPGWRQPDRVDRLESLPDGLIIWLAFNDPAIERVGCRLRIEADGHVTLKIGPEHEAGPAIGTLLQPVTLSDSHLNLKGSGLQLEAWASPFRIEIRRDDGRLLLAQSRLEWLLFPGQEPLAVRMSFESPVDEGFFGFGERFNSLNQRGEVLDTLVYEQYKNQDRRTYIPMPWFISSKGYGFFLESEQRVYFDMASADSECWTVESALGHSGDLTAHILTGLSPLDNVRAFSRLTGQAELPPDWIFGPWMSGNEWNTQAEVMRQVELTEFHDIPATVLVIEAWSDETTFYIWNGAQYESRSADHPFRYDDFTFSPDGPWPDPKGMIDELHRRGIKLVLWQIPVLKQMDEPHAQHDLDRAMALERGYCLLESDGQPYRVRPLWFHDSLLLDPSHTEAQNWWLAKRAYLLDDLGIDGFKTDGGEHLWSRNVVMHNGARGEAAMNLYPNLYIGMYHRLMRERGHQPLTFSRAGFTGAHTFPCHWAGDENSTWLAFRASLLAGLNAGLSGIIFWGWDIGGFSGEIPTAELYLRSAAMAAFCPIMQYHSELNFHQKPSRDRTPWNIAERTGHTEVIDIYRQFAQLRLRLMPYLQAEARHCVDNAEPMMRAMMLDWPDEPEVQSIEDQYMLGRSLLIAPVLDPGSTERRVFLPPGEWLDFWTDQPVDSNGWVDALAPLNRIPVFRRSDGPWPVSSNSPDKASAS